LLHQALLEIVEVERSAVHETLSARAHNIAIAVESAELERQSLADDRRSVLIENNDERARQFEIAKVFILFYHIHSISLYHDVSFFLSIVVKIRYLCARVFC
jgi:hypothetical protein